MSIIEHDCSLDLHEAIQLTELLFFTFENAHDAEDWFRMRQPVGSGIYAIQRILSRALKVVEKEPIATSARTH